MRKTVEDLIKEVLDGDCTIKDNTRFVRVARIYVTYQGQMLVEVKQTRKSDGQSQSRNYSCVSEKLKVGESPIDGAARGIKEELGLEICPTRIQVRGITVEIKDSRSYPILAGTRYEFHNFKLSLLEREFAPGGYLADEGEMLTQFEWVDIVP